MIREKVREMLEVIELEGQEKKMPVNLSGGMKKRVGLARSIIRRPSCVLYDEPTAGLDPVVSDSINQLDPPIAETLSRDEHCGDARHEERVSHRRITSPICTRGGFIFMERRQEYRTIERSAPPGFPARTVGASAPASGDAARTRINSAS